MGIALNPPSLSWTCPTSALNPPPCACSGCHAELWGLTLSWSPAVPALGAVGTGTAPRPVPAVSRPAGSGDKGARRRRGPGGGTQGSTQSGAREVRVESLQRVRTDFSPDALQKAVRFSADGALLATGGADGFLRLWEVGTGSWAGQKGWHGELGVRGTLWGHGGMDVGTVDWVAGGAGTGTEQQPPLPCRWQHALGRDSRVSYPTLLPPRCRSCGRAWPVPSAHASSAPAVPQHEEDVGVQSARWGDRGHRTGP